MTFKEELLKAMNTYKPLKSNWFIFEEIINKHRLDKAIIKTAINDILEAEGCDDDCTVKWV